MIRKRTSALFAIVGALVACDPATPPVAPSCEDLGSTPAASSPADRRLLGEAARYPADGMLSARAEELARSQRARREAAWEVVSRVLAPVELAEATPVEGASVPAFRTWYDREDVARVFQHLYEGLGREGRIGRARFTESALDESLGWNVRFVDTLDTWSADRWADYVAAIESEAHVAGVGGIRRIAHSPDATRHVMQSYVDVLRCLEEGSPPAFTDAAPEAMQRLAHEVLLLGRCQSRDEGPYFVASGGELRATATGARASEATLRVTQGAWGPTGEIRCEAAADVGCTVSGPGVFTVSLASGLDGFEGALDVEYAAPDAALAGCLMGPFPLASATVALEWRRSDLGWTFPTFDTSAASLAAHLAPGADATWGEGDGEASPDGDAIYSMVLPTGTAFRLAAMHIRTREVDRWMNITLWWSPDPDTDFGADRPEFMRALGGPWANYKMCVAMEFDERDPDPRGGYGDDHPSLGDALAAVYEGQSAASWCSNPYIDGAPGLVRSNCVGCHQHAMTGAHPSQVVLDEMNFPSTGRVQIRNNFPADGFWGLDGGDDLAATMSEIVQWWESADRAP